MDWYSIKKSFRFQSGRSKRINEQLAAERDRKRYLAQQPGRGALRSEDYVDEKPVATQPRKNTVARTSKSVGAQSQLPIQEAVVPDDSMQKLDNEIAPQTPSQKETIEQPHQSSDDTDDFDLRPPARVKKSMPTDEYSEQLFSDGHLETILHDPELLFRFSAFLQRYRPQFAPALAIHIETQKAIKAVEYANAVAASIASHGHGPDNERDVSAAHLYTSFQDMSKEALETLLSEALPAYISYNLIKATSEILVNEITGRKTPIMKGLVRNRKLE